MNITYCDICKEIIEKGVKSLHISYGKTILCNNIEICLKCGKSVLKLLKDKKLIKGIE